LKTKAYNEKKKERIFIVKLHYCKVRSYKLSLSVSYRVSNSILKKTFMKPIHLLAVATIAFFSSCEEDYEIKEISAEEAKTYADPTLSSYFVSDNESGNLVVTVETDESGISNYLVCKESNQDLVECREYRDSTGTGCPPDCGVPYSISASSELINSPRLLTEKQRTLLKENVRKGQKGFTSYVIPEALLAKVKKESNARLIKVYVGSIKNKKVLVGYGLDSTGNRAMGSRIYSWKYVEGKSRL
jgi:hypothetical protein